MEKASIVIASGTLQVVAVLLQVAAAVYAFRLMRLTGRTVSWILISAAFCLMALRRTISIWHLFSGAGGFPPLLDESVTVGTSVLLLAGVFCISPLFRTIQRAAEAMRRAKEDLEIRVAERTEELREANARLSVELDERRQAEQRLAQYAQELRQSNAELEQFAYVASHDLQEPLRMVASFTQLLKKRYQGQLDQDAEEFIGFAVEGAQRMQVLLNDLLAYSRVGTRGKPFGYVDCNVVLRKTLDNLAPAIAESGATITSDPLPTVLGDDVQLMQLFQNLIANALKFRSREPLKIHVLAGKKDGHWVMGVQDNGIGIAPEHQERIFLIFQRLHSRSEYPGTGIGLAICQKIVERHGGRLWVESQPLRGATFYFTIAEREKT